MKKFWMIKNLLLAGFMAHAPLLGYASIPQESNRANAVTAKSFYFALDSLSAQAVEMQAGLAQVVETQAVEETASLMRAGLENLGAGDIRGVFALPTKENVHQTAGEIARVAFLDTAGGCFMYDSITSKMALCDREEEVLVRDQEELVAHSLSYLPADSLESVQVAILEEKLCPYVNTLRKPKVVREVTLIGGVVGLVGGAVGISVLLAGIAASATAVAIVPAIVVVGIATVAAVATGAVIVAKETEEVICPAPLS